MPTIRSEVLYLNLELPSFALKKRFEALNSKAPKHADNALLNIANGRGHWSGIESLYAMVGDIKEKGIDLIVIDPLYKVEDIDESDQARVKEVLRIFDDITMSRSRFRSSLTKGIPQKQDELLAGSGVFERL